MRRALAALLAGLSLIASIPVASAMEGESPVVLTQEAANFDVTVPTGLPVVVSSDGTVTVATDATITNNSPGPVVVKGVHTTSRNGWGLLTPTENVREKPVGSKYFWFTIENFVDIITAGESAPIVYNSDVSPQKTAVSGDIMANVVFTVGWQSNIAEGALASLQLDKSDLTMYPGTSEQIDAITKDNAAARRLRSANSDVVIWSSSKPSVATVTDGEVEALTVGTTTITATYKGVSASCMATVKAVPTPLTAISFSKRSTVINNGWNEAVLLIYNPGMFDGTANVTLTSSDTSVISVTPTSITNVGTGTEHSVIGLFSKGNGNAKVTATAVTDVGTTLTATIDIVVGQPMESLTIAGGNTVKVSETLQLTATKLPSTTTDTQSISWASDDNQIAFVSPTGLVTGVNPGTCTISATCGIFQATLLVTVGNGTVDPPPGPDDTVYTMATDADFSGTENYYFKYIGTDEYVEIPAAIKGVKVTSYALMFENTAVKGVKSTNTGITAMSGMFKGQTSSTLKLDQLNTSGVTTMASMFQDSNADALDLSNFDTSAVTVLLSTFQNSKALSIDLSSFNTASVINTNSMFLGSRAQVLDLRSFTVPKLTDSGNMFVAARSTEVYCKSATELNYFGAIHANPATLKFSTWDGTTPPVTDLEIIQPVTDYYADNSYILRVTRLPSNTPVAEVVTWSSNNTSVATIDKYGQLTCIKDGSVTITAELGSVSKSITITVVSFKLATDLSFKGVPNNNAVDHLKYYDTYKYVELPTQVKGVTLLTYYQLFMGTNVVNVKSDNNKVWKMMRMFYNSTASTIDVSQVDTSNVTSMEEMFLNSKATVIDMSGCDLTKANVRDIFKGASATIVYARTQADADKLSSSSNKPSTLKVVVK